MTPELTQQEIDAIVTEAEEIYPDVLIDERGIMELWEMYEHNDMQGCKREAYIAALTSERLKHKAEILAYRFALRNLVQLKKWKDEHGKDQHYRALQPEAWVIAEQTLNQFKQ